VLKGERKRKEEKKNNPLFDNQLVCISFIFIQSANQEAHPANAIQ